MNSAPIDREEFEQILDILCDSLRWVYIRTESDVSEEKEEDDTDRIKVLKLRDDLYVEQEYKLLLTLVDGEPFCIGTYDEEPKPLTEEDKIHCETLKIRYNI